MSNKVQDEMLEIHEEMHQAARKTVDHVIRLGELCEAKKEEVGHGNWEKWLTDNMPFSKAAARNYILAYRFKDVAKTLTVSDLSDLYRHLRDCKRKAKQKKKQTVTKRAKADPLPKEKVLPYTMSPKRLKEICLLVDCLQAERACPSTEPADIIFQALKLSKEKYDAATEQTSKSLSEKNGIQRMGGSSKRKVVRSSALRSEVDVSP